MLRLDFILYLLSALLGAPEALAAPIDDGGWFLSRGEDREVRLSISGASTDGKNRWHWTTDFQPSALEGLDGSALDRAGQEVSFRLARDAGTFHCEGKSTAKGRAAGDWSLELNAGYPAELERRGYARPTAEQHTQMAWADVSLASSTSWRARATRGSRSAS